jgi:hypothetical protein
MLDAKLELSQFAEILKILRLGDNSCLGVLNRFKQITEDGIRQLTVTFTTKVASSLVNILRSPEGSIGNINVDG